jgi:AhpC/TSA family/Thiol:disulfide interchange protein DsbD, N-terminal
VELEGQREALRRRGLGLAALSYDSVAILKDFAARKKITFPLLSDPDSKVIRAFGLLNEADYPPGDLAHGVPYPGTFVTDADAVVRSKFFEKTYAERRTAASFLTLAGETPEGPVAETSTPTFTLRTSSSNREAAPGQRVTLVLDFEMKPAMHAYAPGVQGYRPLRLRLDPQPLVTVQEPLFPPSRSYHFAPLDETVPVFEGRFRITQDVTLAGGRDFTELLKTPDPRLELTGTLEYQVCSDRVCYPPAALSVRWTIAVLRLDRERSPEAIQHVPAKP